MSLRLFVYGSLKRGFRHHEQLRGAPFEAEVRTAAGFKLFCRGSYPVLVQVSAADSVLGEVYTVTPQLLTALDDFEGEGYVRKMIALADGSSAQAYVASDFALSACTPLTCDVWREDAV